MESENKKKTVELKNMLPWIRVTAFLVIFVLIFGVINRLFMLKKLESSSLNSKVTDSYYYAEKWDGYRQKSKNSIDILFLGTSVVHCGVDNNLLFHDLGVTSYDLSADCQRMDTTYYYLKEALKYQSPQIVFVEIQAGNHKNSNIETASAHYNFDYMKNGLEKLSAMMSLNIKNAGNVYIPFLEYHDRWEEIGEEDFKYIIADKENLLNGHFIYMSTTESERPVEYKSGNKTLEELGYSNSRDYLDKIVKLCKENDIECVFFKTPLAQTEGYSREDVDYYNAVGLYAEENNIKYWDFNQHYNDMDLNFATDFSDGSHLNLSGSRKFTNYLEYRITSDEELRSRLSNKKEMEGYEEWDNAYAYENRLIQDYYILNSLSFEEQLGYWNGEENYYILTIASNVENMKECAEKLESVGFYGISKTKEDLYYIGALSDGNLVSEEEISSGDVFEFKDDEIEIAAEVLNDAETQIMAADIRINDEVFEINNYQGTIGIIIYDEILGKVIDQTVVGTDGYLVRENN